MNPANKNAILRKASALTAAELCWGQQTEVQAQSADGLLGIQAGVSWLDCSQQVYIQYKNTNEMMMV